MTAHQRLLNTPVKWLPDAHSYNFSSLESARDFVEGMYVPHTLSVLTPGAEVNLTVRSAWTGQTGLVYMDYKERVQISPEPLDGFVLVQIPLAGEANMRIGERVIGSSPALATLPSAKQPSIMQWGRNNPHLCIYIDQDKLNQIAASLYGITQMEQDVHLGSSIDLRSNEGARFLASLEAFHWDIGRSGNFTQMARLSEEALIGRLLLSTKNSISTALSAWDTGTSKAVQKKPSLATDFKYLIDKHYHEDVSIGDFAERLSVSIRTLQGATAKELGLSPRTLLLHRRLEASRDRLLDPDYRHIPISEIAIASGFNHLGRFASAYRRHYNELPSETRQNVG